MRPASDGLLLDGTVMLAPETVVFHRGGLVFALRHGEFAHVDDVPNGLACGCVCEECGGALVARNHGLIRISHFAHAAGQACNNTGEAGLARCAASMLTETRQLRVPERPGVWPPGATRLVTLAAASALTERGKPPEVRITAAGRALRLFIRTSDRTPPKLATEVAGQRVSALQLEVRPDAEGIITAGTLAAALVDERFGRWWLFNDREAPARVPPPPAVPRLPATGLVFPRVVERPIASEPMVAEPAASSSPVVREPGPRFCWKCGRISEFELDAPNTLRCRACRTEFLGEL